jgi:hypothetical protein
MQLRCSLSTIFLCFALALPQAEAGPLLKVTARPATPRRAPTLYRVMMKRAQADGVVELVGEKEFGGKETQSRPVRAPLTAKLVFTRERIVTEVDPNAAPADTEFDPFAEPLTPDARPHVVSAGLIAISKPGDEAGFVPKQVLRLRNDFMPELKRVGDDLHLVDEEFHLIVDTGLIIAAWRMSNVDENRWTHAAAWYKNRMRVLDATPRTFSVDDMVYRVSFDSEQSPQNPR